MYVINYPSILFLLVMGHGVNTNKIVGNRIKLRNKNVDDLSTKENSVDYLMEESSKKVIYRLQPKKTNMVEKGFWSTNVATDPDLPYYSILNDYNKTNTISTCKDKGFSCLTFPTEMLEYYSRLGQNELYKLGTFSTEPASDMTLSTYSGVTTHLDSNSKKLSAYAVKFNDPDWKKQWYMQDYRTTNIPVMDHNVVPVLNMGITGRGVTVAIVGEGIRSHPDLGDSYDNHLSYNFCYNQRGSAPDGKLFFDGMHYDSDGTSNAGVIAMQAGNGICGVGIAPGAKIVGYKMLKCERLMRSDYVEHSLDYQLKITDIYCNVWMSYDLIKDTAGSQLYKPREEAMHALQTVINKGRNGLGAFNIFPSGRNRANSNCATNGFLNNPYVITIASATQDGKPTSYSERCSAIIATAYSGDVGFEGIATIDAYGKCSTYFTDRPAGPAIASGIIALLLEANPLLTYRDVIHIIAQSAEVAPLADNANTWYRNGRGFWVSNDFGFGLLNAENMINLAREWEIVPRKQFCALTKTFDNPLYFDYTSSQEVTFYGNTCSYMLMYLEHVELEVSIDYTYRGAISLDLTSPAGTRTTLLEPRRQDLSSTGYKRWNIMSLHYWGENPRDLWKLNVSAIDVGGVKGSHGYMREFVLKLHGTQTGPKNFPRKYAAFRLPNGKTNQYV